jgi:hypothetical protein
MTTTWGPLITYGPPTIIFLFFNIRKLCGFGLPCSRQFPRRFQIFYSYLGSNVRACWSRLWLYSHIQRSTVKDMRYSKSCFCQYTIFNQINHSTYSIQAREHHIRAVLGSEGFGHAFAWHWLKHALICKALNKLPQNTPNPNTLRIRTASNSLISEVFSDSLEPFWFKP